MIPSWILDPHFLAESIHYFGVTRSVLLRGEHFYCGFEWSGFFWTVEIVWTVGFVWSVVWTYNCWSWLADVPTVAQIAAVSLGSWQTLVRCSRPNCMHVDVRSWFRYVWNCVMVVPVFGGSTLMSIWNDFVGLYKLVGWNWITTLSVIHCLICFSFCKMILLDDI